MEHPGTIGSIPWLLMQWLRPSPGHQQTWCRVCTIHFSTLIIKAGFQLNVLTHCWKRDKKCETISVFLFKKISKQRVDITKSWGLTWIFSELPPAFYFSRIKADRENAVQFVRAVITVQEDRGAVTRICSTTNLEILQWRHLSVVASEITGRFPNQGLVMPKAFPFDWVVIRIIFTIASIIHQMSYRDVTVR